MEEYGKILVFVMPIFLILIIIEKIYGHYKGENTSPNMDSVSSVSSGMVNSVKDVLGLSITLISYDWIVSKIAIFNLEATVFTYLIFMVIGATVYPTKSIFYGINMPFITAVKNSIWLVPCANLFPVLLIYLLFY